MFYDNKYNYEIESVLHLTWSKKCATALPRPFNALSIRIHGGAKFIHEKEVYTANKNDIIFVPYNYGYVLDAQKDEELYVIHFKNNGTISQNIELFAPLHVEPIIDLFQSIYNVWSTKQLGYKFKTYSLFYSILEQLQIQTTTKQLDFNQNLLYAMNYLQSNFSDPLINISKVAKLAGVSETYFRQIFKKTYGLSPIQFLTSKRVAYATELLKSGYYSVAQVSSLSGFNDSKYFSVVYKKETGKNPFSVLSLCYKKI